jgi:hypothetical protein
MQGGGKMTADGHRWRADPAKWEACGRLERLGAAIGALDATAEHVQLLRRGDGSPIEDSDVPGIVADMNTLEDATALDLSETAITDVAAPHLGRLRTVTALYLSGVRLTDASVPYLAAIPRLRELVLSGSAVTDAGLAALAQARGLRFLQLYKTGATRSGVAFLKGALPGLEVEI